MDWVDHDEDDKMKKWKKTKKKNEQNINAFGVLWLTWYKFQLELATTLHWQGWHYIDILYHLEH